MKNTILFAAYLIFFGTLKAQSSAAEAKAAYLLAEEAFSNTEYKKAINYLQECKTSLGGVNSKIMYLQIMAELELSKTDPSYLDSMANSIAAFYKAPDVSSFNEEKSLEVMKLKIRVKELKATAVEDAVKAKEYKEKAASTFQNWTWQDWPLYISLTDLKALKKGNVFFPVASHGKDAKTGIDVLYTTFLTHENAVQCIFLKDEKVIGYRAVLAFGGTDRKPSNYESEIVVRNLYNQKRDSLTKAFGFAPQSRVPSGKFYKYMDQEYCWTKDGKTVSLLYDADVSAKNANWYARIFIDSVDLTSNENKTR